MTYARWITLTFLSLLGVLCISGALLLVGLSTARQPDFPRLLTSSFSRVEDFPFQLVHEDCDLLIYGDSSAMTSESPLTLEAVTHLKTCNISQTQPVLGITGSLPVDLYLQKNRLPKYLVIQVAPETFYASHRLDKVAAFDPISLLLRQGGAGRALRELIKYPQQILRYMSVVLQDRYKPDRAALARFEGLYGEPIREFYRTHGLMTLATPVETVCLAPRALEGKPDFQWIDEARKRYSALGVKVVVAVSPVPECDPQLAQYREELSSHVDIPIWTLPLRLFNDGDRHFTREGAELVSKAMGERILILEGSGATAKGTN